MKKCIISFQDKEIVDKMISLGYECYPVIESDRVSAPISSHADVLYKKVSDNEIIVSSCQKANFGLLRQNGYIITEFNELKPGYKTESYLNYIDNDKYIICNNKTVFIDKNNNKKIINVNQGYTRCSCIEINSDCYITDDESIYNSLVENKIDCLKIKKGFIKLDGYNYGFIGGASVKLSDNELLFFGDISDKEEKDKIVSYLNKRNIKAIFIENKKLTDIGSAIIL